jgi:ABC-2 type transport system permease protein
MTLTLGLLQFVMFLVIFPLTQIPTLLPLGIETGLHLLGHGTGIPIYLLLSLLECAVVVFVYRLLLRWEGELFQAREQKILECVTNRAT